MEIQNKLLESQDLSDSDSDDEDIGDDVNNYMEDDTIEDQFDYERAKKISFLQNNTGGPIQNKKQSLHNVSSPDINGENVGPHDSMEDNTTRKQD